MRDTIGSYPYDTTKVNGKTVLRFYPKGADLKHLLLEMKKLQIL